MNIKLKFININHQLLFADYAILYRTIMKLTTVVKSQSQEIQELRHTLERFLKKDDTRITTNTFVEKYNFKKIHSVDDFRAFDNCLKDNEDFRNDFVSFELH